jgi:hypothetical protein
MGDSPYIGELWEFLGDPDTGFLRNLGVFRIIARNDSPESPDSWVMGRLIDGATLYMHKSARLKGQWKRWVNTAPTSWQHLLLETPF